MIAAFFDVDGTLYTAHMWRGLMQYASEHGHKNRVRSYYASLMPLFYLRKLHLIDEENFRKPWVSRMGWIFRGWNAAEGDAAFRWIADDFTRPTARDDIIARLSEHVAKGHVVILVSAQLAPSLAKLGAPLGVTGTVGTEIEIKDGRYTGKVSPHVCMGVEKDRLTREFLRARGIDVDWQSSYAYADSISDLPLFEMVGHPVAVYPDPQLAALAREKKWEILPKDK
ncbi:MAG TPA: HAD-IB family hydrolase [Anaerolineae bacterium]